MALKKKDSEKKPKQNFFGKPYSSLEKKYFSVSEWFTKKGIPLNKLNNSLEKKGLPAFPIIIGSLLLILFIIIFLIFFTFSSKASFIFIVQDHKNNSLTDVYLTITSPKGKVYSGVINDGQSKKIKLKIGETYNFSANKEYLPDFSENIIISQKNQTISIIFPETLEFGVLKVFLKDKDNKKIITSGTVKVNYTLDNKLETQEASVDPNNSHQVLLSLPILKDLEIIVSADGYENFKEQNYRLTSEEQEKTIELEISNLSFSGKSKTTFIVLDKDQKYLDDALVTVYNFQGEEIASQHTENGFALVYIDIGETISYTIKKEKYMTYVSDPELSLRIKNSEETFTTVLFLGGDFLEVRSISKNSFLPIENTLISLYDQKGSLIDSGLTSFSGDVKFTGLSTLEDITVLACHDEYLCESKTINLAQISDLEFLLEKLSLSNSAILNLFVIDQKNLPLPNTSIKIFELLENSLAQKEMPYKTNLKTDVTGSLAVPLPLNKTFRVYAVFGESSVFEDITINPLKENKIIFVIDDASKFLKLEIYDSNGSKMTSGHLLLKTKDSLVLYDDDLLIGRDVLFETLGYKDIYAVITHPDGFVTSTSFSVDQADETGCVRLDLSNQINTSDHPIIEFAGILDEKGKKTNFLSLHENYYLVFDVLFPENTFKGEVHIRAGEDTQTDVYEMSYGIVGFSAIDASDFKYGTTYNPEPTPGMQSIDNTNQGAAGVLNKWLELKWNSKNTQLGNKQIKIKVKALDLTHTKLKFKYRVLFEENKLYYRDPIDPVLSQNLSTKEKYPLYANTKEIVVDLFELPLNCEDDFCVSYKFIDAFDHAFEPQDFYAVKDNAYALELSLYSVNNSSLDIFANTARLSPVISLENFSDFLPTTFNFLNSENLDSELTNLSLTKNVLKKVYLNFLTTSQGVGFIELKAIDNVLTKQVVNTKLSFNVYEEKEMKANISPDSFITYGSNFSVELLDAVSLEPIKNATFNFYDERGALLDFQNFSSKNLKSGKYNFKANFNVSVVDIVVNSYGYTPLNKKIFIVDDSILQAIPEQLVVNLGLDQTMYLTNFSLRNISPNNLTELRFGEVFWIQGSDKILIDVVGSSEISKNSTQSYELNVITPNNFDFTTANANLGVFAKLGNREVSKVIPITINKGLQENTCLEITPTTTKAYVGLNLSYSPPSPYNTPFTTYDSLSSGFTNPMVYPNFDTYAGSQMFTQGYSSSLNTINYTDPNYYSYYSSAPNTTQDYSENTTFFIIKNNCSEPVTFTPEAKSHSLISTKDLELSLPHITLLPGEEKVYDVIIKNYSKKTQPSEHTYSILWHNNFYSVLPSTLDISLLDLSSSLWVVPEIIHVPISQVHSQINALNSVRIFVKNIGTIPIRNIQISQYPKLYSSNIGLKEFIREVPILEPGSSVPIDLAFQVNINKTTFDNIQLLVTGEAVGYKNPIHASSQIIFSISSPNCLKVSNKNLDFKLNIGEKKTRSITLTNHCAEPVSVVGIDKKDQGYFETFGMNRFRIYPSTGNNIIFPNTSQNYNLEVSGDVMGGSIKTPMVIIGNLTNSGNPVTSEDMLISVSIKDVADEEFKDQDVIKTSMIPICENLKNSNSYDFPIISVNTCTEDSGYCDAITASELVLKKVNELNSSIKQFAAQTQSKVLNTGCAESARHGYCKISELGGNVSPLEFSFYLQNDALSKEVISHSLKKSNYDFKNYFVEYNPNQSNIFVPSESAYYSGGRLFVPPYVYGCGKYTFEIDGFVAANIDYIYPERVHYYVSAVKYKETQACETKVSNYLNFLPWDVGLDKNNRVNTWLTLFSGNEEISKKLISSIGKFSDDASLRFIYPNERFSTKSNVLNVSVNHIVENEKALAKIYFTTSNVSGKDVKQTNLVLNKYYEQNGFLSENVIDKFTNIVSSMIKKNDFQTEICISNDDSYMLILDVIKAGDLVFLDKDPSILLSVNEICMPLRIKSSVDETLKITSSSLKNLDIKFKINENDSTSDIINLDVKQNKDENFFVCMKVQNQDDIASLVNQKVEVTATSIFSKKASVGNRSTSVEINLSSCGITPSEYLLKIYDKIHVQHDIFEKENFNNLHSFYVSGLIDWDKKYNPKDQETMCEALQKVFDSGKQNKTFFYDYKNINCELKDSSQKSTSKLNKAITNGLSYFGRCSLVCSGCYGITALIQPASLANIVFDCLLFSCGIPALTVAGAALSDGEGGISAVIDQFVGFIFAKDDFNFFKETTNNISEWLTATFSSVISGSYRYGSAAAATPLTIGDSSVEFGQVFQTGTTPVPPSIYPAMDSSLTSQFKNFGRYLSGTDNIKFTPLPGDAARLTALHTKMGGATVVNLDITKLTSTEITEFASIIDRGSLSGPWSGNVKKNLFATRLNNYSTKIGGGGGVPVPATNIMTLANRDAVIDMISKPDGLLIETDNTIKVLEEKIAFLEKNNARSKFNPVKTKPDPNKITFVNKNSRLASSDLDNLRVQLSSAKSQKVALEGIESQLKSLKPNSVGEFVVPENLFDEINKINGSSVPNAKNKLKFVRGGFGIVRSIGCGILGNVAGINGLKKSGKVGLNNSIFVNDMSFNKNLYYIAEINLVPQDQAYLYENRYQVEITLYDPTASLPNESVIERVDKCS